MTSRPNHTSALLFLLAILKGVDTSAQVDPPLPYGASTPINYIRSWDAVKPTVNANDLNIVSDLQTAKMTTQYYDGLGRKIQTTIKQGSLITNLSATDLVSAIVYDEYGRELYNYLPFSANNTGGNTSINDGLFKLNPFQQQAIFAASQFPNETFFYGKTNFEPSPLNRVISTYAPGNSWSGSEGAPNTNDRHGIGMQYLTNTANDAVRVWDVNSSTGAISTATAYGSGQLYKTVTTDENKKNIIEYKNKNGLIILRKVQIEATPGEEHTGWLCTYYVYDDLNNIRLIVPPKATNELSNTSWNLTEAIKDELCFRYEYDERNRTIIKKVPGAAETRIVYDARDRVVLSQDGKMRNAHQWFYTQYDGLNRPIATGLITDHTNYDHHTWHRDQAKNSVDYPNLGAYTYEELTGTFYDNYAWRGANGNPLSDALNTSNNGYFIAASDVIYPYPQAVVQDNAITGLITGSKVKVLGTGTWLYAVNIYDKKSQLIQVQSQNISDGTDIATSQYSWAGQVIFTVQQQQKGGTNPQTTLILTQLTYDDLGRLAKTEKRVSSTLINNGNMPATWQTISENEYDALGQLKKRKLGSALESMTYDFNIRGWTLGVNREFVKDNANNYFGYELAYDKVGSIINGSSYAAPQYNGNIGGTVWKSKGDGAKRKYDFSYDPSNRLLKADFNQYTSGTFNKTAGIDFSVLMGDGVNADSAYDYNGNILRMQQWGLKGFTSARLDDLRYTYSLNNRLKNVIDGQNDPLTSLGDFRSSQMYMTSLGGTKTINAVDYTYDDNGNLTNDLNKDITDTNYDGIEYVNPLNLPSKISVKNKGTIEYLYDALGNKLQKTVKETGKPDQVTLYIVDNIYQNDTLQFVGHEEGRIRPKGDSVLVYDYFIKDYLGNVRMVLTEETDPGASYYAGMETVNFAIEDALFTQISETADDKPAGFDTDSNNQKVSKLFSASGNDKRVGPGLVLKVMAGDKFKAGVKGWYLPGGTNPDPLTGITGIVGALVNAFTGGLPAGSKFGGGSAPGATELTGPLQFFVDNYNNSSSTSIPKAYLNWVVLEEEQFQLVEGNFGAVQIPEITGTTEKQVLVANGGNDIEVKKNGYLYVYVSNESQGNVYFDELAVVHTRGAILEETHYYPFGLAMKGLSSSALAFGKENKRHKYNGYEFNGDFDLNLNESFYRSHDPQLGRFLQLDPKPDHAENGYSAMSNNPLRNFDIMGDTAWSTNPKDDKTLLSWIKQGLNLKKGQVNPFSIGKDGQIHMNEKAYNKLSDDQKEIADGMNGLITSKKNFEFTLVEEDEKIGASDLKANQKAIYKMPDGTIVDAPNYKTIIAYGGETVEPNKYSEEYKKNVTQIYVQRSANKITVDGVNGQQIEQANYTLLYHGIGHAYNRDVLNLSNQKCKTVDYENNVRRMNNLPLRAYDRDHPEQ